MRVRMQVDGLIVNCTAFNPTPSLSAAVVNHFKFKSSIRTFNLSGMGCAASVIAIDMAQRHAQGGMPPPLSPFSCWPIGLADAALSIRLQ